MNGTFNCLLFALAFAAGAAPPEELARCLFFQAPAQKTLITAPACTLGVDSACKKIYKTEIKVRYFPPRSDTAMVVTLGKIYRAPFKQIWDLSQIPNQLFIGIGVIIEVTFLDGDVSGLIREGIFLAHHETRYPAQKMLRYEYANSALNRADTIRLPTGDGASAFAFMHWNENALTFRVTLRDTAFHIPVYPYLQELTGVEICLDPAGKRRPYPAEDVMIYSVPLSEDRQPYRINYHPVFGDSGTFRLNPEKIRCNFDHSVEKKNHEGFTATLSIPCYLFGKSLPPQMGYNIIVKTADSGGRIQTFSLADAKGYNNYSPLLWATLAVIPKPVFMNRWLLLFLSFFGGLLVPLAAVGVPALIFKDRPQVLHINRQDERNKIFEPVKRALFRYVTQKNVSASDIAAELNTSPHSLLKSIKRMTGLSFKNYVMYLRIEIVCERLRSSHSSEVSIADSCGFRDVNEMTHYFQKFHHMTPAAFRKMQQISQLH